MFISLCSCQESICVYPAVLHPNDESGVQTQALRTRVHPCCGRRRSIHQGTIHNKSSVCTNKPCTWDSARKVLPFFVLNLSENFADCRWPFSFLLFWVVRPHCHPVCELAQVEGGATSAERPLGLVLLDEPSVTQSDPTILELKLRWLVATFHYFRLFP